MEHYGTIADANQFFSQRLNSTLWQAASDENKSRALCHATQLIDRFDYIGSKHDESQPLEFPRDTATVPTQIEKATYLIAQSLLDGQQPESRLHGASMGSLRMLASNGPEGEAHLILSGQAFNLIRPFLRSKRQFEAKQV